MFHVNIRPFEMHDNLHTQIDSSTIDGNVEFVHS